MPVLQVSFVNRLVNPIDAEAAGVDPNKKAITFEVVVNRDSKPYC